MYTQREYNAIRPTIFNHHQYHNRYNATRGAQQHQYNNVNTTTLEHTNVHIADTTTRLQQH